MTRNRYYQGPVSDHFDGKRFYNPDHPSTDKGLADMLRWRFGGKKHRWPKTASGTQVVPEARVETLRITMIGHASLLIQASGQNLLVDPVWSDRVSPVSFAGPRRVNAPGIAFAALPPIDTVLLTHNHYDHCDLPTLRRIWERDHPRMIAPLGNDGVVARVHPGIEFETFDWWAGVALDDGIGVTLIPAKHWSARGLRDRRMALWCGFVIASPGATIYLSGDTGYGDGRIFREVAQRFPSIDIAILPIGAYAPRSFMKPQHVDPAEAVQIMLDCGARQALGVHWGTFPLSNEGQSAPKEELAAALRARRLAPDCFVAMTPGEVW